MNGDSNRLIYNVPYCPEYNPIEYLFSKSKQYIRMKNDNNINLIKNITDSFKNIRMRDLKNYYNHSLGIFY
jgi:transposase